MRRPLSSAAYKIGTVAQALATLVSATALSAIAAVVCVDVALRYLFNSPFDWSLEFIEWFALFLFVFALPRTTFGDGHVRMDLLLHHMSPAMRRLVTALYAAIAILILATLFRAEWGELLFSWELWTVTEMLRLPNWPKHLAVLIVTGILIPFFAALIIVALGRRSSRVRPDTLEAFHRD